MIAPTGATGPGAAEAAFLEAIRAHPDLDGPRLVYADWLDERGEAARAEFIRVQVELALLPEPPADRRSDRCEVCGALEGDFHRDDCCYQSLRRRERDLFGLVAEAAMVADAGLWEMPFRVVGHGPAFVTVRAPGGNDFRCEFRRGFVASVTLTCAQLVGGSCEVCEGIGHRSGNGITVRGCPDCHGTGRIPGCAAALGRLPGLERVTQRDRGPFEAAGVFSWYDRDRPTRTETSIHPASDLPPELFNLLACGLARAVWCKSYPVDADARAALSAAALALCRAGAPESPESPECPACGGRRYVAEPGTRYSTIDCPDCGGTGRAGARPLPGRGDA